MKPGFFLPAFPHRIHLPRSHAGFYCHGQHCEEQQETLQNPDKLSKKGQRGGKRQREGECCQEKGDESLKMNSVAVTYTQGWILKESDQTLTRILLKCSPQIQLHLLGNKKCPAAAAWNKFNPQTAFFGEGEEPQNLQALQQVLFANAGECGVFAYSFY